jgi:hypothetical protein
MDELASLIRKVPLGFQWVLRSGSAGDPGEYYCHVWNGVRGSLSGAVVIDTPRASHWASTPEEAFALCLQQLEISDAHERHSGR